MNAADELERMAEWADGRSVDCQDHARQFRDAHVAYGAIMAKADAFLEAAMELRARAAELRKPLSVPMKPERVDVGQWWSFDGASPGRVARRYVMDGYPWAAFEPGGPEDAKATTMIISPRWICHGDGPEPAR